MGPSHNQPGTSSQHLKNPLGVLVLTVLSLSVASVLSLAETSHAQQSPLRVSFQPFDNSKALALQALSQAKQSVHVAQYNIRDRDFANKLLELKNKGLDVKVVVDAKNAKNSWNVVDDEMEAQGLTVVRKSAGGKYGIMHHKFTVIDGQTIMTGSFNWNHTAQLSNNENMLIIHDAKLARDYEQEFQELLGAAPETRGSPAGLTANSPMRVLFSPEDRVDFEIIDLIRKAKKSVHVAMFTFYDRYTSRELVKAAQRGVKVELITEAKQASRSGEDEKVAQAGGKVIIAANRSAQHSAMHHKYAVVDEQIVITGACNWTYTAFKHSFEDVLIIRDQSLAKSYLLDFADLMKRYDAGYTAADYAWTRSRAGVQFVCKQDKTKWGDQLCVVGNHAALGFWDPKKALKLETSSSNYPQWSGSVSLPANSRIEYKYIVLSADGKVRWEQGFNRLLVIDAQGRSQSRLEEYRQSP